MVKTCPGISFFFKLGKNILLYLTEISHKQSYSEDDVRYMYLTEK